MDHLTDEQLAGLVLSTGADEQSAGHVAECDTCRARLEALRRVKAELAAAHAEFEASHVASRDRLRAALSREPQPVRLTSGSRPLATLLGGLNMRQRVALGGVGLSTAAVIVLMLFLANPASELSAMERMVKAVRGVTSFSFTWKGRVEFEPREGKPSVIRETTTNIYWRAPGPGEEQWFGDFAAPCKIVGLEPDASGDRHPEVRTDITEIYPTGKQGILIDYLRKYYFRTEVLMASELPHVSPVAMLRTIQEGSCNVVRELGTRQINGRDARGYVVNVKDTPAFHNMKINENEVEVWVDPETDLPMEFSLVESEGGEYTDVNRVVDCRWNIELDDKLFHTTPPAGFINATAPSEQSEIDSILAALRLYAELSGGKYPELLEFDRDAVRRQMLENAGFTGPQLPDWAEDAKYQQIEAAMPALQRLADVLVAKYHSGYYAEKVGAQDKDNVLVWWPPKRPTKGYLAIFGDLHSEHVPAARLVELEPATKNLVVLEDE
jgi:outer membrane lipoprotein-sorting protein